MLHDMNKKFNFACNFDGILKTISNCKIELNDYLGVWISKSYRITTSNNKIDSIIVRGMYVYNEGCTAVHCPSFQI